jgi:transposase
MPAPDTECFQIFLNTVAKTYSKDLILLVTDGAGNHRSEELEIPANMILQPLPPYSPELNPQENIWDEIREKIFKNSRVPLSCDPAKQKVRILRLFAAWR